MKKHIIYLIKHPLILGSSVIFIGSMAASLLNYFFNLAMGRSLSVTDYGTFASLISVFNIFSVFMVAVMMIFSKFSASLVGQKKENHIGSLFISGTFWVGIISSAICLLLIVASSYIASFLNINSIFLIILIVLAMFFSFLSGVPLGILQGLLKFGYFSSVNIFSSLVKLVLGIAFVFLGYKTFGAVLAFFLSAVATFLFGFIPLYKYIKKRNDGDFTISSIHKKAYTYGVPVFLSNVGIIALVSIDIILVKHYFNPTLAGQYSALSLMGRSIFYVVSPISSVLFPLIAQKRERNESLLGTLLLSVGLVSAPSLVLSAVYFIFPQVVLKIFFPSPSYANTASHLGMFSVFIFLYSMAFLLNSFYLSIGKVKVLFFTIFGACLEAVLIMLFHSSISEVINMLVISSFLLLISLLLYYRNASENPNS